MPRRAARTRTDWRSAARSRTDLGPTLARLGQRVRAFRTAKQLTQEELALRSQLDSKHIQTIESGGSNVTVSTLLALADGLGCSVAALFEDPESASRLHAKSNRPRS